MYKSRKLTPIKLCSETQADQKKLRYMQLILLYLMTHQNVKISFFERQYLEKSWMKHILFLY